MAKTETRIEFGFMKRKVDVQKCGCEYRSLKDPVVKAGIELHGYLVKCCDQHGGMALQAKEVEG